MAQQERLRNSIIFYIIICICSCHAKAGKESVAKTKPQSIAATDSRLQMLNGRACYNGTFFTGTIYYLFDNSNDTVAITSFKNGREDGIWKKFYLGKAIREQREFTDGKKTGLLTAWWQNGQKQLEYFFSNDEYEGTCREWNKDGVLIKEMNYENGHEEGAQKYFYDNGKVRSNYVVINGKRYGLLGTKNCVNVKDSIF